MGPIATPVQILPTIGLPNLTEEPDVRNDLIELRNFMPNALLDYRPILRSYGVIRASTAANARAPQLAGIRYISGAMSTLSTASLTTICIKYNPNNWGFEPGANLQLKLRVQYIVGAVAPGCNFTVDVFTTTVDFTTGAPAVIAGTVTGVSGSSLTINNPSGASIGVATSADFSSPTTNFLGFRYVPSAVTAATSDIEFYTELLRKIV